MTPEFINQWIFPATFSLLPPEYDTPAARRLMIAIGLQESRFKARRQMGQGPARSFWQAWAYYLKLWRPGKPKPDTWPEHWQTALEIYP